MSGYLSVRTVLQAVSAVSGVAVSEIIGTRRSTENASIEALAAVYARRVGPIPSAQPAFKTTSNAPRKEASNGRV